MSLETNNLMVISLRKPDDGGRPNENHVKQSSYRGGDVGSGAATNTNSSG